MSITPPPEITSKHRIDVDKWGEDFNANNEDDLNKETVNGYILFYQKYYKDKYNDIALWEYFREDFKGWTKDIFVLGTATTVREFRDFLRTNGC